ncbi:13339_t:CDS:2, partial [Funneliformis mosseae]
VRFRQNVVALGRNPSIPSSALGRYPPIPSSGRDLWKKFNPEVQHCQGAVAHGRNPSIPSNGRDSW